MAVRMVKEVDQEVRLVKSWINLLHWLLLAS